ncbi:hypothetical protein ACF0H5_013586 [Mactra antiquata]
MLRSFHLWPWTKCIKQTILNRLKVPIENLAQKTKFASTPTRVRSERYASKDNDDTVTDIKLPPNYQSVGIDTKNNTLDVSCCTCKPEIAIEDIQDSDDKVLFYTGLPSYCIFMFLFSTLLEFGGGKIGTTSIERKQDTGWKRKLPIYIQKSLFYQVLINSVTFYDIFACDNLNFISYSPLFLPTLVFQMFNDNWK